MQNNWLYDVNGLKFEVPANIVILLRKYTGKTDITHKEKRGKMQGIFLSAISGNHPLVFQKNVVLSVPGPTPTFNF